MYPHVVQFETRKQEFDDELRLIRRARAGRRGAGARARWVALAAGSDGSAGPEARVPAATTGPCSG